MDEQQLKQKIKNTMLMDKAMKDRLLSVQWDDELLRYIYDFFEKYSRIEDEIGGYIAANSHKIIINYIHELEIYERENLTQSLEELKKLIFIHRKDI